MGVNFGGGGHDDVFPFPNNFTWGDIALPNKCPTSSLDRRLCV